MKIFSKHSQASDFSFKKSNFQHVEQLFNMSKCNQVKPNNTVCILNSWILRHLKKMKYWLLSGTFITHNDCPLVGKEWEVFSESAREGKPSGKSPLV